MTGKHNNYIVFKNTYETTTEHHYTDTIAEALEKQWRLEILDQSATWNIAQIIPSTVVESWLLRWMRKIIRCGE